LAFTRQAKPLPGNKEQLPGSGLASPAISRATRHHRAKGPTTPPRWLPASYPRGPLNRPISLVASLVTIPVSTRSCRQPATIWIYWY